MRVDRVADAEREARVPDVRFGDLLSRHRLAAGLTQEQLAEKAGLTAQAVSTLERGVRQSPRRHTVAALAAALELVDAEREAFETAVASRGPTRQGVTNGRRGPVRCLPAAVGDFTGRAGQVDRLRALLTPSASSATVVVSAIGGMGGVGKTALAVHVGHQLGEAFPDGQLYVNLRGFGPGEPMTVSDALGVLLSSLGVADGPQQVDRAVARYRAALANMRILVVLDNASDERQVEPLLPNAPTCAAIVTSRRTLAALPGAQHIQLDVLAEDEATDLLMTIVGPERNAGSLAGDVNRIVDLCGRLPLAIRIAGARLVARPNWPLHALADQLVDERRRLDLLEQRDVGVRATLEMSADQLARSVDPIERAAAEALPFLGVLEVAEFGLPTAARLLDAPRQATSQVLDRLVDLHLIDEHSPGRFRMHDLIRTFASERAHRVLAGPGRLAALIRVLRLYNSIAWEVFRWSNPTHVRLSFMDPTWVDAAAEPMEAEEAEAWLTGEWRNLISLVEQAGRESAIPAGLVTQVAISSLDTFHSQGLWSRWIKITEISLRVAVDAGDLIAEAFARYDLGGSQSQLGHMSAAEDQLNLSLERFRRAGSLAGEAMASCHLAHILEVLDRTREGLEHAHRSLDIAETAGHWHLAATTCLALGMLYGRLGDRERERHYGQRSLEIFERIDYKPGRARALYNLGLTQSRAGRNGSALRLLLQGAEACDAINLIDTGAAARVEAAAVCLRQGKPDIARRHCEQALDHARRASCEIAEARSRQALGDVLVALSDVAQARSEWRRALAIYERLGAAAAEDLRRSLGEADPTGGGTARTRAAVG